MFFITQFKFICVFYLTYERRDGIVYINRLYTCFVKIFGRCNDDNFQRYIKRTYRNNHS